MLKCQKGVSEEDQSQKTIAKDKKSKEITFLSTLSESNRLTTIQEIDSH